MFDPCIVMQCTVSFPVISLGKRELVALIYMSCDSQYSVSLPRAVVGLSAAHDCGIHWSIAPTF